jgi:hypothetical protein
MMIFARFHIESDGYSGSQGSVEHLKSEKKSLILRFEFLNTKVLGRKS